MNQQLIQGEGVGAGSVRRAFFLVVVVVVVLLDDLVAVLVLVVVDDLVAPVISASPRRRFLGLVVGIGIVVTLVLVVVDLDGLGVRHLVAPVTFAVPHSPFLLVHGRCFFVGVRVRVLDGLLDVRVSVVEYVLVTVLGLVDEDVRVVFLVRGLLRELLGARVVAGGPVVFGLVELRLLEPELFRSRLLREREKVRDVAPRRLLFDFIRRREDLLEGVELVDGEARAGAALQGGRRCGLLDILGGAAEALARLVRRRGREEEG